MGTAEALGAGHLRVRARTTHGHHNRASVPVKPSLTASRSPFGTAATCAGPLDQATVISLQARAGNRAVRSLLSVPVAQRKDPDPALKDVQDRLAILEKKDAARAIDAEWQPKILSHIADRKQAIYAVSGAFQAALSQFQNVQTKQSQTDAVKRQWEALAIAMVVATAYEPIFDRTLGKWSTKLAACKDQIENPLNTLVQGYTGNVAPQIQGADQANKGQAQSPGAVVSGAADPVTFLTAQLGTMEGKTKEVETAFSDRSVKMGDPKFDWNSFSATDVRTEYAKSLREAESSFGPSDGLKGQAELTNVIERHNWASWIQFLILNFQWAGGSFGKDINRRLNELGIPGLAGTGKLDDNYVFYASNPSGWEHKVGPWSTHYDEKLAK